MILIQVQINMTSHPLNPASLSRNTPPPARPEGPSRPVSPSPSPSSHPWPSPQDLPNETLQPPPGHALGMVRGNSIPSLHLPSPLARPVSPVVFTPGEKELQHDLAGEDTGQARVIKYLAKGQDHQEQEQDQYQDNDRDQDSRSVVTVYRITPLPSNDARSDMSRESVINSSLDQTPHPGFLRRVSLAEGMSVPFSLIHSRQRRDWDRDGSARAAVRVPIAGVHGNGSHHEHEHEHDDEYGHDHERSPDYGAYSYIRGGLEISLHADSVASSAGSTTVMPRYIIHRRISSPFSFTPYRVSPSPGRGSLGNSSLGTVQPPRIMQLAMQDIPSPNQDDTLRSPHTPPTAFHNHTPNTPQPYTPHVVHTPQTALPTHTPQTPRTPRTPNTPHTPILIPGPAPAVDEVDIEHCVLCGRERARVEVEVREFELEWACLPVPHINLFPQSENQDQSQSGRDTPTIGQGTALYHFSELELGELGDLGVRYAPAYTRGKVLGDGAVKGGVPRETREMRAQERQETRGKQQGAWLVCKDQLECERESGKICLNSEY